MLMLPACHFRSLAPTAFLSEVFFYEARNTCFALGVKSSLCSFVLHESGISLTESSPWFSLRWIWQQLYHPKYLFEGSLMSPCPSRLISCCKCGTDERIWQLFMLSLVQLYLRSVLMTGREGDLQWEMECYTKGWEGFMVRLGNRSG